MTTLGMRMKRIRKAQGLTQTDLQDMTGLAQSLLSKYESGRFLPSRENVAAIAAALGVSPGALEYGEDAGPPVVPEDALRDYLSTPEGRTVTPAEADALRSICGVLGEMTELGLHYALMAIRAREAG